MNCHFLLEEISLTQGLNSQLSHLLQWRADSFTMVPPRKPQGACKQGIPESLKVWLRWVSEINWGLRQKTARPFLLLSPWLWVALVAVTLPWSGLSSCQRVTHSVVHSPPGSPGSCAQAKPRSHLVLAAQRWWWIPAIVNLGVFSPPHWFCSASNTLVPCIKPPLLNHLAWVS